MITVVLVRNSIGIKYIIESGDIIKQPILEMIDRLIKERDSLEEENELLRYALFELTSYLYEEEDNKLAATIQEIVIEYNKTFYDIDVGKKEIDKILEG